MTAGLGLALPFDLSSYVASVVGSASLAVFLVSFAVRQSALEVVVANGADAARTALAVIVPAALMLVPALREPAVLVAGIAVGAVAGIAVAGAPTDPASNTPASIRSGNGDQAALRKLWSFGAPLIGWTFISILINTADRYLIEWSLGTASVGYYSAIYDIVFKGVSFMFMPVVMAVHPAIMNEWNNGDRIGAARIVRRAGFGLAALAVVLVAVVGVLSGSLAAFAVRPDTLGPTLVLPIAIGAAAWQVAMIAHKPLELRERTGLMLVAAAVTLAINVGVNAAFLGQYGLRAAAYATMASGLFYLGVVTALSTYYLSQEPDTLNGH